MDPERTPTPFVFLSGQERKLSEVSLESERLRLEPVNLDYIDVIHSHFTTEVTVYMYPSGKQTREQVQEWIESVIVKAENGEDLVCAVLLKDTGEFLGCCGIHGHEKPKTPELGVWVKKEAHGNGYGLEAVKVIMEWANSSIEYEYCTYPVDRRNHPSVKIPVALGGEPGAERQEVGMDGNELDLVEYRIYSGP